jgi:hypothetical protein
MSKFSKFLYLDKGAPRTADLSINVIESAGFSAKGAVSGSIVHKASDTTSDYTVYWPSAQGSAQTMLTNDGAGQLAWTPIPTSSATISNTFKAGQSFSANTSYVVRWGINALGEDSNKVYAADFDTASYDEFWAFGIAFSPVGVSAGDDIHVYSFGIYNLASGDVPFSTADVGNPVWLGSAGALVIGAPSGNLEADLKVGIVVSSTQIWIDGQMMGVGSTGGASQAAMPIDEGGTGANTQQDALNNLLGGIKSAGQYVLSSDGANFSLSAIDLSNVSVSGSNVTGDIAGNAANITATSNSTLTSLPNLVVSGSQVSGNISGNAAGITGNISASQVVGNISGSAANITATSNSTLTSLPNLSLSGSQVAGNISGSAANITASSNATLTSLPNLVVQGSQVSGNISGSAANITASSNSTLTSLPNLALPASQVTGNLPGTQVSGDIAGKASNITATSNSTLTSLPNLSLPGSQVSGDIAGNAANVNGVVGIAHGGTGATDAASALAALAGAIYDAKLAINALTSSGTPVTLPSSMTFLGAELQIYLNGQLLFMGSGNDWQASGAGPAYTAVTFGDNLQVGDVLHFVKLRNA